MMGLRLPGYADARVRDTWTGIVTDTPDGMQIVGESPVTGFYNAVAGNGHGFKEAPGFAESLAATIVGDEPRFDLSPYRLGRFEAGEAFVNRYSADWLG